MKIFLTGGAGDLGKYLCRSLLGMGHTPIVFDIRDPLEADSSSQDGGESTRVEFMEGSILDRARLKAVLHDVDVVVHIAAWHGIHEFKKAKSAWEFWDLNVGGTFNVFQTAYEAGIQDVIFISSTSIDERFGIYGHTKILGEEIATTYAFRHGMNVITLRPRAFIPPYNTDVYSNFIDWAKWFSKGAVHISDVAQSVIKSIELLHDKKHELKYAPICLTVDGAYEYSEEDLANWDVDGPGTTFKKHYKQFYDLAVSLGLDPTLKPTRLDIEETRRVLNYRPLYSMKTLLLELKMYGAAGPYANTGARS